jgi:chorismate mutase
VTSSTSTPTNTPGPAAGSLESLPPSEDITALRQEIDQLDTDILRLIQRRTEVSRQIGAIRRAEGGPRIVLSREQAVLARFRELGPEGRELGMMLLRLGRGRLGRA